jgi:hypothetical protein
MAEAVKKGKAPVKARKAATKAGSGAGETKASAPTHEEIAHLANKYWQERGRKHGHAEEDWLRAEEELRKSAR